MRHYLSSSMYEKSSMIGLMDDLHLPGACCVAQLANTDTPMFKMFYYRIPFLHILGPGFPQAMLHTFQVKTYIDNPDKEQHYVM